jgi:hypothetical protein
VVGCAPMTRASVAVVAFAIAAAIAGCREEPTIVIKFEPNDMSGAKAAATKPADLATAAAPAKAPDLGTVTATKPPAKTKGAAAECKVAADCVVLPLECCDCANGGKQHAIPKKQAAAAKAARAEKCKAAVCTMMLSTDPSCGQRPDCVDGACVMVKK